MNGCAFYPPASKSLSFMQKIKRAFKALNRVYINFYALYAPIAQLDRATAF